MGPLRPVRRLHVALECSRRPRVLVESRPGSLPTRLARGEQMSPRRFVPLPALAFSWLRARPRLGMRVRSDCKHSFWAPIFETRTLANATLADGKTPPVTSGKLAVACPLMLGVRRAIHHDNAAHPLGARALSVQLHGNAQSIVVSLSTSAAALGMPGRAALVPVWGVAYGGWATPSLLLARDSSAHWQVCCALVRRGFVIAGGGLGLGPRAWGAC